MINTKVAFMEGRLLSGQSEQFEKLSKSSGWKKAGPPKKTLLFWSCKQANSNLANIMNSNFMAHKPNGIAQLFQMTKNKFDIIKLVNN